MTLDCSEIVSRLDKPEAVTNPEIRAHLASCASCRQAHDVVQELRYTSQQPSNAALASLSRQVKAACASGQRQSPAWLRPTLFAGLLAASGAAAIGLVVKPAFFQLEKHQAASTGEDSFAVQMLDDPFPGEELSAALLSDDGDLEAMELMDDDDLPATVTAMVHDG